MTELERYLNGLTGHSSFLDSAIRFAASDLIAVTVPALLILWFLPGQSLSRARRQRIVAAAILGMGLSLVLGALLGHFYVVSRPFVVDPDVHPLISHSPDASFPSDHALAAFALAGALLRWQTSGGVIALALACAVSFARVVAGLHWPTDVIAGAFIGIVGGYASAAASDLLIGPQRLLAGLLPQWVVSKPSD